MRVLPPLHPLAALARAQAVAKEATNLTSASVSATWHTPGRALGKRPATKEEGIAFRSFVRDFLRACSTDDGAARIDQVRAVLVDHADVLRWIAEGRDLDSLCQAADLRVDSDRAGSRTLETFVRRALLGQLERTLQRIPRVVPRVIGRGTLEVSRGVIGLSGPMLRTSASAGVEIFSALDRAHQIELLSALGDAPFASMAGALDRMVDGATVSRFPAVEALRDPERGIDLGPEIPKSMADLFQRMVIGYFDRLSLPDKRGILTSLLELPPQASLKEQLSSVVQSAGPALQKLFQFFAQDAQAEWIREVLHDLLSRVKAVEGPEVRALIEAELGRPIDELFQRFSDAPLSSGSVGQVHAARLRSTGEEVVVKIIKPGVRERALREMQTIRSLIDPNDPFEVKLIDTIEKGLLRELDLRIEAENIASGERYHDPSAGITIARRIEELCATENVIVQVRAQGVAMSELPAPGELPGSCRATELAARGEKLALFANAWFESAMFDGFFHADPHPGNRFWDEAPLLTVIDFGSADRLSSEQRRAFVGLSLAASARKPQRALEVLRGIAEIPPEKEVELLRGIERAFEEGWGVLDRIARTLRATIEAKVSIPRELFLFSRAHGFLTREIREINLALDAADPEGKLPRHDPLAIYARTLSRHAPELARMAKGQLSPELLTKELVGQAWQHRDRIKQEAGEQVRGAAKRWFSRAR